MNASVQPAQVLRIEHSEANHARADLLAVEEPLAIRLGYGPVSHRQQKQLSVTMRTPGHDFELVLGFLLAEGIIRHYSDIINIKHCADVEHPQERENTVRVELSPDLSIDWEKLQRYAYTSSSCGVCGKTSIQTINSACLLLPTDRFSVPPELIQAAPAQLRKAQVVFEHTGGLHAAGLFDEKGELLLWREDVGRHNALDKLIGAAFGQERLPLSRTFVLLSGRVSFELVQKALMAGVPVLAAIGAPSSLAVQLAATCGMTLLGFVRHQHFNIYTGSQRIACPQPAT